MIRNYRYEARPARTGDRVIVYATGINETSNIEARIGSLKAAVDSITPVPQNPGLFRIVTQIPAGVVPGNSVVFDIVGKMSDGSIAASNPVNIAVEPSPSND